jgi:hypothetical protein
MHKEGFFTTLIAASLFFCGSASGVLFTNNASIAANDTNYEGQDIVVIGCTLTIDGPHSFSELFVFEDGVLTHSPGAINVNTALDLTISNDVLVEAGSRINADGLGYAAGAGPGAGATLFGLAPFGIAYTNGGGGAFGGNGGGSVGGAIGGSAYGSLETPANAGSGGGDGLGSGGNGGGIINLTIGGALVMDGQISANGEAGASLASGGGSGGSIQITAGSAFGAGSISANGGGGQAGEGGGGGGGRVALSFGTNEFSGSVTAYGGAGFAAGGAGTIFVRPNTNNSHSELILDNGGAAGAGTPVGVLSECDFTVTNGAIAILGGEEQNLLDLFIGSNSFVQCPNAFGSFQIVSNVIIEPGGGLIGDGAEGRSGPPPTLGSTIATNNISYGGGGGNGGFGGSGAFGAAGGNPTRFDSQELTGGGAGGGVLQIRARGSMTLGGVISANGEPGLADNSGGGGGGRIAVYAPTNDFSGVLIANGGYGFAAGGTGTIFLSTNAEPLIVLPELQPAPPVIAQTADLSTVTLAWTGSAGASYQVQSSPDLLNWQSYGGVISGVDGAMSVSVAMNAQQHWFFRLVPVQ